MLKGIDPCLGADLLHLLADMGHGDELVIADANFPASRCANRLIPQMGMNAVDTLAAVLTLLPLDQFVSHPAAVMAVVDDDQARPPIYADFQNVLDRAEAKPVPVQRLERFAFYDRAKNAFGVILTSETRLYGNIILSKGVVFPDA